MKERLHQHFSNIHKTKGGPDTVRKYPAGVSIRVGLRILKVNFRKGFASHYISKKNK